MSQGTLFGPSGAPVVEETEASLTAQIAALDEVRDALIQRREALRKEAKEAALRAKFEGLPAEVQEMLKAPEPDHSWIRRLHPRGLVDVVYSGRSWSSHRWSHVARDLRRVVLGVEG